VIVLLIAAIIGILPRPRPVSSRVFATVAVAVLVLMLLTRQTIQDRAFFPLDTEAHQNAAAYSRLLDPNHSVSLVEYQQRLATPVVGGGVIYSRSCAFCHGEEAAGMGGAARDFNIAPKALSQIRTTPIYLQQILLRGIHGSAMAAFGFYTPEQLDALSSHLGSRYEMFAPPGPSPVVIPAEARQKAQAVWSNTCATCHGEDGRGSHA
jgi:mono/diheme cytochrome c family protein